MKDKQQGSGDATNAGGLKVKRGQARLKDIARSLNISISTVSRALGGSHDINAETRKAVVEMAGRMAYAPN